MVDETPLGALRGRVGLEETLGRLVASVELAATLRPAIEAALERPGEAHRPRDAAQRTGLHPFEFCRSFRRAAGVSFHDFVDQARVDAALVRLATTELSSEDVTRELGFLGSPTLGLSIAEHTGLPLVAVLSLLRP